MSDLLVGVIADTHGLLRPEVFAAFAEVGHILHAGDVGDTQILADLAVIAPVWAVWGNTDGMDVRSVSEESGVRTLGGMRVAMTHGHRVENFNDLPASFPGAQVIVHGHSHLPRADRIGGILLLNPGSAGPRRPGKPVAVALLEIRQGAVFVQHLELNAGQCWQPGQKKVLRPA